MIFKLLPACDLLLLLLSLIHSSDHYNIQQDSGGEVSTESPQPFPVPLPRECSIPNNHAHSYDQGQCSRRPCQTESGPCSLFWRCCYEVGQVSSVPFSCSNSDENLLGSMIITCECQPCDKLHAYIRGRILSSRQHHPVVLAAVLLGTEVVTFTDEDGRFFFELGTMEGEVHLKIQEVRHREAEVDINLRSSLTPNVAVTLEYIEDVRVLDKLQLGFHMELGDLATSEVTGINASISVPPRSLRSITGYEVYTGSGHVLHSLYHMDSRPWFTSTAIQSMVYRDSKGVDFSIQSHVSGSLRIVGEMGKALCLKQGSHINLKVAIKFDVAVEESQVEGLHVFTYPEGSTRWIDNGKVTVDSVMKQGYFTWAKVHANLRESNVFWAVGFPSRINCYIKSKVSHLLTKQEQLGVSVQLEQSFMDLDRPSFYLASGKSSPGEGVCLKAVCGLGGLLYIMDTAVGEDVSRIALTPSTDHALIMGNQDQVMFYNVEKGLVTGGPSTPYYPTEEECMAASLDKTPGHFEFLVNVSLPRLNRTPSSILPALSPSELFFPLAGKQHCYTKVGVYSSLQSANIQVLSYSLKNHSHLLSMSSETVHPSEDIPLSWDVMTLHSACVEYVCESDIHVSASTWLPGGSDKSSPDDSFPQQSCRYWSSHSSLTSRIHLSDAMTSFHLMDRASDYVAGGAGDGLYRSPNKELALFQCGAGDATKPTKIMDHISGVAVTFTCD